MNLRQQRKQFMKEFSFLDKAILANYRYYYGYINGNRRTRLRLIIKIRQRQYDQFFRKGVIK